MKKKTVKIEAINKNAAVGTRNNISSVNSLRPISKTSSITIRPSGAKKRRCSGCSRKRKRG